MSNYNIVMFAHNEERNIINSIQSVISNTEHNLNYFYIIANGCSDNTADIIKKLKAQPKYDKIKLIELELGDKCNAWNHYVHQLADETDVHFFVDADVQFTKNAFEQMTNTLIASEEANAIAGLPFSGRNKESYLKLVIEKYCLFGNCYGVKKRFIDVARQKNFKLPIGLSWIDSAITKAVNTDVGDPYNGIPGRVTYNEKTGYFFKSLKPYKWHDIKLYINRISRYKLGQLQEKYLEKIEFTDWPENLGSINKKILNDIKSGKSKTPFYLKKVIIGKIERSLI